MDWLDLLAVQGTLKSLQHHSSKAHDLANEQQTLFYQPKSLYKLWNPAGILSNTQTDSKAQIQVILLSLEPLKKNLTYTYLT